MMVAAKKTVSVTINCSTLYWLPAIFFGTITVLGLKPTLVNSITSPFNTTMLNTPWLLEMVPRFCPFTAILTLPKACKLSAVITTPYNCTTESLKFSNCAFAATGINKALIKMYRKNSFIKINSIIACNWAVLASVAVPFG